MTKIPVYKNLFAIVDDCDADLVSKYSWRTSVSHKTIYAKTNRSRRDYGNSRGIFMHRLILGANKGLVVDHINGDGLDNRRSNLRICTPAQNRMNLRMNCRNKSGARGVSSYKRTGRWRAQIAVGGKKIHIGIFDSIVEASAAYEAKAAEVFGEFLRKI